jgi:hypothetical protein
MNKDLLLNTDTGESIQGHVGQNTTQIFFTLTAKPFSFPKLKLEGYEFLQKDQFGNHYFKMRALLCDGELYDCDQFIKPSMMMRTGGGHADFEDPWAKKKLRVTDDLFTELREQGKLILARTNLDILKARSLSTSPVALEPMDISKASTALEDAIKAAKVAAGETVEDEKTPPAEPTVANGIDPLVETPRDMSHEPTFSNGSAGKPRNVHGQQRHESYAFS